MTYFLRGVCPLITPVGVLSRAGKDGYGNGSGHLYHQDDWQAGRSNRPRRDIWNKRKEGIGKKRAQTLRKEAVNVAGRTCAGAGVIRRHGEVRRFGSNKRLECSLSPLRFILFLFVFTLRNLAGLGKQMLFWYFCGIWETRMAMLDALSTSGLANPTPDVFFCSVESSSILSLTRSKRMNE